MRTYRVGDLPDIQISNNDILKPLKALCYRDNLIAQIILSSLVTSLLKNAEQQEASDLLILIIKHINTFKFTNKFLLSAFFNVCLKQPNTKLFSNINCKPIVRTCKLLNMEPLGIHLLQNKPNTDSEPVRKKARKNISLSSTRKVMDKEDLLGLIELYNNIGDDSSARGIFLEFTNEPNDMAWNAMNFEILGKLFSL